MVRRSGGEINSFPVFRLRFRLGERPASIDRIAASRMRILLAHNRYQQRGGEDVVFENEVKLLAASGHDVDTLVVSNDAIVSLFDKTLTALRTAKNPAGTAAMALAINRFRPDIVHVHNFFPLLSPAIYRICPAGGNCRLCRRFTITGPFAPPVNSCEMATSAICACTAPPFGAWCTGAIGAPLSAPSELFA